ncbi:hypothetical protein JTB14_034854 [Gonioctena quinquepunctata]|nr:hypothetical protein JTB14_034854 [Gonioctena quinquepunctata]
MCIIIIDNAQFTWNCDHFFNILYPRQEVFRGIRKDPEPNFGFWTSGKKLSHGGSWNWLDGKPITYFNWHQGEPNGYEETESGMEVFIVGGEVQWNDKPNADPDYYICESSKAECGSFLDNEDFCPATKTKKKRKYVLGSEQMTFFKAIQYCQKMFMQLAKIEDEDDSSAVFLLLNEKGVGTDAFWTSGNQRPGQNTWQWLDGEPVVYFNWNGGEPNNDRPRENCISVFKKNFLTKWDDAPCDFNYYPLCEKLDPVVNIYINQQLISTESPKIDCPQSDVVEITLDLEKDNYLLGWEILRK